MATKRRYGKAIIDLKDATEHCFYCGKKMAKRNKTIDHIIPIKNGGSNCADNLVVCCRRCNSVKGGYTIPKLIDQLRIRYKFADDSKKKQWEREIAKWKAINERLKARGGEVRQSDL